MVSFLIDRVQTFWHSTACHWLHTANWQFLATATVLTAALFVGTAFLRKQYMKKYYLPNLPIIQGVPYFGLTKLLLLDNELKSHEEVLHIVREKGPVAQFYLLGQHIVLINDGFIAKYVMEQLTGKGMFHVSLFSPSLPLLLRFSNFFSSFSN